MKILNLTQHEPTPDQVEAGVENALCQEDRDHVKGQLTFKNLPTVQEIFKRAEDLADLARRNRAPKAMVGCAPWFVEPLCHALLNAGVKPVFAFSSRVSEEKLQEDGTTIKTQVFKHQSFIPFV